MRALGLGSCNTASSSSSSLSPTPSIAGWSTHPAALASPPSSSPSGCSATLSLVDASSTPSSPCCCTSDAGAATTTVPLFPHTTALSASVSRHQRRGEYGTSGRALTSYGLRLRVEAVHGRREPGRGNYHGVCEQPPSERCLARCGTHVAAALRPTASAPRRGRVLGQPWPWVAYLALCTCTCPLLGGEQVAALCHLPRSGGARHRAGASIREEDRSARRVDHDGRGSAQQRGAAVDVRGAGQLPLPRVREGEKCLSGAGDGGAGLLKREAPQAAVRRVPPRQHSAVRGDARRVHRAARDGADACAPPLQRLHGPRRGLRGHKGALPQLVGAPRAPREEGARRRRRRARRRLGHGHCRRVLQARRRGYDAQGAERLDGDRLAATGDVTVSESTPVSRAPRPQRAPRVHAQHVRGAAGQGAGAHPLQRGQRAEGGEGGAAEQRVRAGPACRVGHCARGNAEALGGQSSGVM